MLTPTEIDKVVREIVDRMQPQKIIIFGSYAKGTATIKSDLDIFVMEGDDLTRWHIVRMICSRSAFGV